MRDELIAIAAKLFEEGRVDLFIGYGKGTLKFKTTPLIARSREELQKLWVEDFTAPNLALYLKEIKGRIGILVKGCDSRSLVSLLKEGQVKREDLYVVGVPCPGQLDLRRIREAVSCEPEDLEAIQRQGPEILIRANGREIPLPKAQALLEKCLNCQYPKPLVFDALLPGEYVAPVPDLRPSADAIREKPVEERWAFWAGEFERCIRCYACRNVCPACFCPRCLVEENEPQWVSPLPTYGDNLIFHLMRMMHVAGTCTSCGECQRVCPVGIPLMKLNEKMAADLQELFQFVAGVDMDAPLPFRTFSQEDQNDFIR